MIKKIISCILLLVLILSVCASLASCGTDGADGKTPYIGENGNWWIGDTDLGVSATGPKGEDGKDGKDGVDGADGKTPYVGKNGNWWVGNQDTGIKVHPEDDELDTTKPIAFKKSSSHVQSNTVGAGHEIEFSITIKNNTSYPKEVVVNDKIPSFAEFVGECDTIDGNDIAWHNILESKETRTISYKLKIKDDKSVIGEVITSETTVNGEYVSFYDIFVEGTLGTVDRKLMTHGINVFRQYTNFRGVSLLNMMWCVGANRSISYKDASGKLMTAAEILEYIYTGVGGSGNDVGEGEAGSAPAVDFKKAVIPTIYGGIGVNNLSSLGLKGSASKEITEECFFSGDAIFVQQTANDEEGEVFVYDGSRFYSLSDGVNEVTFSEILYKLNFAYRYAGIRESMVITNRSDFAPEEELTLTPEQEAVIETARAYMLRADRYQYSTDGLTNPDRRYEWGEYTPEDITSDEWKYTNCAMLTYDCYYFGLDYDLGQNYYTEKLIKTAKTQGIYYFEQTGNETEAEMLAEKEKFFATLKPADIIIVRRNTNTGHAMLYIGNGQIIHSSGGNYTIADKSPTGTGVEAYEATVRYMNAYDLFDKEAIEHYYVFGSMVTQLGIYRPIEENSYFTIPEQTANRIQNLKDVAVEKISTVHAGQTANANDEVTYTIKFLNLSATDKTITVTDVIHKYTTLISAPGAVVDGNKLSWEITVPANEKYEITFTVKINSDADSTIIENDQCTAGGVRIKCTSILVTGGFTKEEQQKIIEAAESLASSSLKGIDLVNAIYTNAFGVDNIFNDTLDNVDSAIYEKKSGNTYTFKPGVYTDMVVPTLYGGRKFECSDSILYGSLCRMPREENLMVGDILLGRTSSSITIYLYLGDGICWNLNSNQADTVHVNQRLERFIGYINYWSVIRPAQMLK